MLILQIDSRKKCRYYWTSGQDGGIGRYTLAPHTTKRRTTTNLKTKSNQNCQKTKLYGSLTTKKLKKKPSSRPGRRGRRQLAARQQLEDYSRQGGWLVEQVPHFHVGKLGGKMGATQTPQPRVPVQRNKASKPLTEKICGA